MGTILASTIINKAALILYDVNNVKWGRAELLFWLNDAQRTLVSLVPESSAKAVSRIMTAGTRQTLPSDAYMLLEVTHNMGTSGTTVGRMLKRVDRAILDETNPDWASASSTTPATAYTYNLRDRLSYYVSPPSNGTGYLEIIYSVVPTELAETDPVVVADIWVPTLLDYVMWRCHVKDAGFADMAKAQMYAASFSAQVGAVIGDASKLALGMGQPGSQGPQGQGSGG